MVGILLAAFLFGAFVLGPLTTWSAKRSADRQYMRELTEAGWPADRIERFMRELDAKRPQVRRASRT